MLLMSIFIFGLSLAANSNETPKKSSPSFDCKKANNNAEKAICSDDRIAKLDRDLDEVYVQLLKKWDKTHHVFFKKNQKLWIEFRNFYFDQCIDDYKRIQAKDESFAKQENFNCLSSFIETQIQNLTVKTTGKAQYIVNATGTQSYILLPSTESIKKFNLMAVNATLEGAVGGCTNHIETFYDSFLVVTGSCPPPFGAGIGGMSTWRDTYSFRENRYLKFSEMIMSTSPNFRKAFIANCPADLCEEVEGEDIKPKCKMFFEKNPDPDGALTYDGHLKFELGHKYKNCSIPKSDVKRILTPIGVKMMEVIEKESTSK